MIVETSVDKSDSAFKQISWEIFFQHYRIK